MNDLGSGPALEGWLDLLDPGILPARHEPDGHVHGLNRKMNLHIMESSNTGI